MVLRTLIFTIKSIIMRSFKTYMFGILVLAMLVPVLSCTKSFDEKIVQQTDLSNTTQAQVFIATVGASRNSIYVDGKAVTGSLLTSGSLFPGATSFAVQPGLRSFLIRDTLTATTQLPLAFAENMDAGKSYTIFTYDTITSPKQITVGNNLVIPTDTSARVRFANFIHNSFAVPGVDVYSTKLGRNIWTNIVKTQVTDYIPYRSASRNVSWYLNSADTLYIRETGTSTNIIQINGFNPMEKRSYTILYRGSHRGVRTASIFSQN